MFIEIESKNKKAEIEDIEWGERQITFFLSDFFYLNFENEEEKNKFFSDFIKNTENITSNGQSYVEIEDSLINSYGGWNNFILQEITKLNVKSYYFTPHYNHLEISFSSGKEDLKFVLYKQVIDKIKPNLK
jgi:hypothetical protein